MSLPHIILGMLRHGPKSGYQLKKELDSTIHYFWDTDISRIYRTLYQMNDQGWVAFEQIVQEDNPNKKIYSLTETGRVELRQWLAQPGIQAQPRNPFLAQVHFSPEVPVDIQIRLFEVRIELLREELQELETRARENGWEIPYSSERFERHKHRGKLSLEYGVLRTRFELEWAEHVLHLLKKPS